MKRLFSSILLMVCLFLANGAVASAASDQEKGPDARVMTKEEGEEKPIKLESLPPFWGLEYEMQRHLDGMGLQFSPGAPGGVRPVETYYYRRPQYMPVMVIPTEEIAGEKEALEPRNKQHEKGKDNHE